MTAKPENKHYRVAVVGLGYVGLPLALSFADSGCRCLGFDTDYEKVEHLPFDLITHNGYADHLADGMLHFTSEEDQLSDTEAILVCVPTPLREHQDPDLSHILDAAHEIAPHLRRGMLVSLESSTYPGTTSGEFRRILEEGSGLVAGEDFHLAFSPEREDPGNPMNLKDIPKVIGGLTPDCLERAVELYSKAIDTIVPVSSCETAEAVKLTENIFRYVNIGLVNELKTIYAQLGIDIWEVQDAAKTKPFGFMPFYPGAGVGGHCIPIDPYYLTWKAKEQDIETRFINLAGQINHSMPAYVAGKLMDSMNHVGRSLYDAKILMVGVTYKPGVPDDRESPAYKVMDILSKKDTHIDYHDPHLPEIPPGRGQWSGRKSIAWNAKSLEGFDAAVVCTPHPEVDYEMLAESIPVIIDACHVVPKRHKALVISA